MLHFQWNAVLKDGQIRPQFDSQGNEKSFDVIQEFDKSKLLKQFELVCVEDDNRAHIIINLESGEFDIRGAIFHPYIALTRHNERLHYRIIFYRRMRRHLGTDMKPIGAPFVYRYLLGWQVTYLDLNYQRIIFYDPTSGGIEIQAKR